MTKRIRVRLVVILFLCLLSVYLFAGFPPSMAKMQERIHLGLDLKGGILLELEVVTDDAIRAETDQTIEYVRELLRKENVTYRQLTRRTNDSFVVVDLDPTKESQVRETVAAALPDWDVGQYGTVKLKASREAELPRTGCGSDDQRDSKPNRCIGCFGTDNPKVWRRRNLSDPCAASGRGRYGSSEINDAPDGPARMETRRKRPVH
jgi:preprotein translocase subunit SecD